ncbi:MAG: pyridoxamine kinase [Oscillospiraceae bacterium]|nr:pyridoxamine kinase [Oscillospiraceae bacterium]
MKNTFPKKAAAIHDLSGFGRCSLGVIIPTLSVMNVQVCPVPTAVLSTHTGGFDNIVFKDLTDFISPCCSHYKSLGIEFDAVYSGFLASAAQIYGCLDFFSGFANTLKVVDPVMGDNGKPYKTYTPELCEKMSELVEVADIITPNLTESAILLGEDYRESLTTDSVKDRLKRLCEKSKAAVITGVVIADIADGEKDFKVCNAGYERESGEFIFVEYEHIPTHYPGTGDIFASVLLGATLSGDNLRTAVKRATDFARKAVVFTHEVGGAGYQNRDGVMFESLLGQLLQDS